MMLLYFSSTDACNFIMPGSIKEEAPRKEERIDFSGWFDHHLHKNSTG
jgi:hypothetical protein